MLRPSARAQLPMIDAFEITRDGMTLARDAETAAAVPVKPKPAPPPADEEEFGGSFLVESFDTRAIRPPKPPGARGDSSVEVDHNLPRSMRERSRNTFNHQDEW